MASTRDAVQERSEAIRKQGLIVQKAGMATLVRDVMFLRRQDTPEGYLVVCRKDGEEDTRSALDWKDWAGAQLPHKGETSTGWSQEEFCDEIDRICLDDLYFFRPGHMNYCLMLEAGIYELNPEKKDDTGPATIKAINHQAMAFYIQRHFHIRNILYRDRKDFEELMLYSDGYYSTGAVAKVYSAIELALGERASAHAKAEILQHLKHLTYADSTQILDGGVHSNWLCLKNGIYDLDRFEFTLGHDPDMIFVNPLPIEFDEEAKCPKIEGFLKSSIQDPQDRQLLVEYAAYCLMPGYPIQKALLLFNRGRGGKGTYCRIVGAMLGDNNVSAVPLQALDEERFSTAHLYGKRANIVGEISKKMLGNDSKFKGAVGNDKISAEFKGQPLFDFYNEAKFIFACNRIPPTDDESDGFMARWIIIIFPHNFVEEGKEIKDYYKILTTPSELSGFFNMAVLALKDMKERDNDFCKAASIEETRKKWRELSDTVWSFANDEAWVTIRLEEEEDGRGTVPPPFITHADLYAAYELYCKDLGAVPLGQELFKNRFREFTGAQPGKRPYRVEDKAVAMRPIVAKGKSPNYWLGPQITEEAAGRLNAIVKATASAEYAKKGQSKLLD